ncbi:MAG: electron transfer flavoprotein subunit alpha [Desulfarculaceae bacterium]|nr:electron transfer flavoprotein subunit alpha [Desulfarculaceae bacterium]MCF8046543.1 electron transfer flavoprotein subunit alpha [Desulfarculaceae bacterium]MCF8096919.1 electron transfer flavoprotein subunit alpha [Desulfarculaceae bacterium]MCF8120898.1 electron transfer flavoprotein subunit alpha [Desulfarculaceae bacterium]
MVVIIDKELCIGCEQCLDACPFDALEMQGDFPEVGDSCTLCGSCADVCPEDAITVPEVERAQDDRAAEAKGVWVYAEVRGGQMPEVVAELLGQGRRLAEQLGVELGAVVLGHGLNGVAGELFALGADVVYAADDPRLAEFNDDIYCKVLSRLIAEYKPEVLLAGATSIGRSMIPRVATAVATGLTADCTGLAIDPDKRLLLQTRPAFGGNIMATIVCPTARPQMATVRPRVMKVGERRDGFQGRLVTVSMEDQDQAATKVLEVVQALENNVNLTGAEVVVTGGRGVGGPEGFQVVSRLAEALGGVVGATRGAVDSEWIGHAHQVGQTGRTVAPKLYIALGVSGAVQHLVGMQGSDTIVAVNSDPNAPIFDVAHYGIVGDLFKVAPAMLSHLKQLRGQG